jgi:hypothetical protein
MKTNLRFFLITFLAWAGMFVVSLNFKPPDYWPWNRLRVGPFRFKPSAQCKMTVCGDLGRIKGIKELQHFRDQVFTTDRFGLRNLSEVERPEVVVAGDSYVAGSGLSDEETLTYQMTLVMGRTVYNYGGETPFSASEFLSDPRFQQNPPKVLVYLLVYRAIMPLPLDPLWNHAGLPARVSDILSDVKSFKQRLDRDNYLAELSRRFIAPYAPAMISNMASYVPIITVEGERKLTLSLDIQMLTQSPEERQMDLVVRTIAEFDRRLKQRGTHLVYAPMPEPGSLYPEFYDQKSRARLQQPPFIDLLLKQLDKQGVDYIDLRKSLEPNRIPYLYLPDDTHWDPRAVRLVAKILVDYIKPLLPSTGKKKLGT